MQLVIMWEDQEWLLDTEAVSLKQAFVIKDTTKDDQHPGGRNIAAWNVGIKNCEPSSMRALLWLMYAQNGVTRACAQIPDFPVAKFHEVYMLASVLGAATAGQLREVIEETERQLDLTRSALEAAEAREAAEADQEPEGPTPRPVTASRPSPARKRPASPTTPSGAPPDGSGHGG